MGLHFRLFKSFGVDEFGGMPDSGSSIFLILAMTMVGLLGVLVALLMGVMRRLARIERALAGGDGEVRRDEALPAVETSAGGAFEMFLGEDPARRKLPKSEQFAAYRRWRQEKGLNWTNG